MTLIQSIKVRFNESAFRKSRLKMANLSSPLQAGRETGRERQREESERHTEKTEGEEGDRKRAGE